MARERGSVFIPVIVTCGLEENVARLGSKGREGWGKVTDAGLLARWRGRVDAPAIHLFEGVGERLEVDVTGLSARGAAEVVVAHVLKYLPVDG